MKSHAGHILRVALSPVDPSKKSINILRVFPEAFCVWSLLLFTPPLVKAMHLARDPLVTTWQGTVPQMVFAMPLALIVIAHGIHRLKHGPRRRAIILSLVGSSVILGIQANHIGVNALELSNSFAASDCQSPLEKHKLEKSWQEAQKFRVQCPLTKEHLIQRCPGYETAEAKSPDWKFLRELEQRYTCAGWCEPHMPLWTFHTGRDSCSDVVAQVLAIKVTRDSMQVVIYSMTILAFSIITVISLGPSIRERGIEW
mmetsp:Transcript_126080/g.251736  ORF Transcript_126080/g.251736 Transcript_126080/m.251736 type:complete len:256 (-) Transcript_126080:41-808(-)|eukprot:CAMPEP_0172679078 /NCGR_PEP_ID=MMETSP1074-20121228/15822_1 /TAXON_ID=2916 /ORGANISM="Ceratium fusus, Strain PA161109" /LENGTH=255 /DNA_ID=CAMNT_0013497201 /DNA_START=83 /DNA_END=847 /DNA_ORIENTATION=-